MTITKITDDPWLNLYSKSHTTKSGKDTKWVYASRDKTPSESILEKKPDAVMIAAVINEPDQPLRHVVTAEYRIPIGGYEFGFPAGLIDDGETPQEAAKREMFEETGLHFKAHSVSPLHLVSSAGMSNETVQIVFGIAQGEVSTEHQEEGEDIQVHLLTQSQLTVLTKQNTPMGCVGWSSKAWPILTGFSYNGFVDYYGIKK